MTGCCMHTLRLAKWYVLIRMSASGFLKEPSVVVGELLKNHQNCGSENVANSVNDRNASAELPVRYYKGLSWDIVVMDKPGDIAFALLRGKIFVHKGDKVFETATQLRIVQALKNDLGVSEFGSENVANSVDDKKASAELPVGAPFSKRLEGLKTFEG
ncbi:hypothetical protein ACET3Z_010288 [Daucus carota]